ncbi:hypothetical protein [Pantoea sp. RIT-PI-b]|nr:hypothetical protein [Pantoea sp. RIT-PI-b]
MNHPDNTPHHRQGVAPSAIAPGVLLRPVPTVWKSTALMPN